MVSGAKIAVGVAFLFSIVALIIKITAIALPNFVDVHIIDDIDDVNDDNRIAQVGVYQAEIDTTAGTQALLAAELNIPPIKIESPSTEFPLLFPAQENFFAQVLPVNQDTIVLLDDVFGGIGTAFLADPLADIQNTEFDNCEAYSTDIVTNSNVFFNAFQGDVLPVAVSGISALIAGAVTAQFAALNEGVIAGTRAIFAGTWSATFDQAPNCDVSLLPDGANTPVDEAADCVNQVNGILSAGEFTAPIGGFSVEHFTNCGNLAIAQCLGNILASELTLVDGSLDQPAVFNSLIADVCALDGFVCANKLEYLQQMATVIENLNNLAAEPNADLVLLVGGLNVYFGAINFGFVAADATFADPVQNVIFAAGSFDFVNAAADDPFPLGCAGINLASLALGLINPCESFLDYFNQIAAIASGADAVLGAALGGFTQIYADCLDPEEANLTSAVCPFLFTAGVSDGVFGDGALAAFADNDLNAFIQAECEEDEIDNEKVAEAQIYIAVSTAVEIVAVLVLLAAVLTGLDMAKFLAAGGAVFAFIGAIFVFAALFTVQSAPVYEGVGGEPEGLETIFVAGIVGTLAAIDGVLMIVAGIAALVGTTMAFVCGEPEAEDEEDKKDEAVAVEADDEEKL